MRRLVRHGLAGVGAATFAVLAGVTALGAPTTTLAVPAATMVPQSVVAPPLPVDPVVEAQRDATAERENREAERTRILNATTVAANQRAINLSTQGVAIDQKSDQIKAARAEAKAKVDAEAAAKVNAEAAAKVNAEAAAQAKVDAEAARAEAQAKVDSEAAAQAKVAAVQKTRLAVVNAQGYEPGVADPREMARQILMNTFGYGPDQFSCFDWIITRESNWNIHATNASSGAYGLPQSLPGSKMASVAPDWRDNPATQIIWGVQYMKSRYGSPCGAESHWASAGNY